MYCSPRTNVKTPYLSAITLNINVETIEITRLEGMESLKCLFPATLFQKLTLILTLEFRNVDGKSNFKVPKYHNVYYIPKLIILGVLVYFQLTDAGREKGLGYFLKIINICVDVLIPIIIYSTDLVVERKMSLVMVDVLELETSFRDNQICKSYGKVKVFSTKILTTIISLIISNYVFRIVNDTNVRNLLLKLLFTIPLLLINVTTARWATHTYMHYFLIEALTRKMETLAHAQIDHYTVTLQTLKSIRFLYNRTYFVAKRTEMAMSLNVFMVVVHGYVKIFWNLYKGVMLVHSDTFKSLRAIALALLHFASFCVAVLPSVWVEHQRKELSYVTQTVNIENNFRRRLQFKVQVRT